MKRLLIFLTILSGVALVWAAPPPDKLPQLIGPPEALARITTVVVGGSPPAAPACADSSCTGFLGCQNFEGTGYDNSETWTKTDNSGGAATVDPDYTGTILRGSQSLRMVGVGDGKCLLYCSIPSSSTVHGFFRLSIHSVPSSNKPIIALYNSTQAKIFSISVESTRELYLNHGTVTNTISARSLDTTYYVWWDYTAGSGSNGTAHIYIGTTTTKPSATSTITTGTSTTNAVNFAVELGVGAYEFIVDQILIDDTAIGDVCS